jgi:hypothetical protein
MEIKSESKNQKSLDNSSPDFVEKSLITDQESLKEELSSI